MAEKKISRDKMLGLAQSMFKNKDYARAYKYCTELMKGKSPSVVVYMQCISSLELRRQSKDFVDTQINDTLLLTVALDNFYDKSYDKNENVKEYIRDILFCLLTCNIESVQNYYGFKKRKRSLKLDFANAQNTISNLRILKNYDFAELTIDLPEQLLNFIRETGEKLIAFVSNSITIMEDPTNNWLYEDETNDLYERIVAYRSTFDNNQQDKNVKENIFKEENYSMDGDQIDNFVDQIADKEKPKTIISNFDKNAEDADTMVSKQSDKDIKKSELIKDEFDDLGKEIDESKNNAFHVEKLNRFSPKSLSGSDILIGVLILLFVIFATVIILYLARPEFFKSLALAQRLVRYLI